MTGLAFCSVGGSFIGSAPGTTHARVTIGFMEFGVGFNWFNAPKIGADDNCPVVSNTGQADSDGDGLGDAGDQCAVSDLLLSSQAINTSESFFAENNITTGDNFLIDTQGIVSLTSGNSVTLSNGTTVSGELNVILDPDPCN